MNAVERLALKMIVDNLTDDMKRYKDRAISELAASGLEIESANKQDKEFHRSESDWAQGYATGCKAALNLIQALVKASEADDVGSK